MLGSILYTPKQETIKQVCSTERAWMELLPRMGNFNWAPIWCNKIVSTPSNTTLIFPYLWGQWAMRWHCHIVASCRGASLVLIKMRDCIKSPWNRTSPCQFGFLYQTFQGGHALLPRFMVLSPQCKFVPGCFVPLQVHPIQVHVYKNSFVTSMDLF